MKDVEYNRVLEVCRPILQYWLRLLCPEIKTKIHWLDRDMNMEQDGHPYSCIGHCSADWAYQHAVITLSASALWGSYFENGEPNDDLEEVLVHEVCHILVNEMRDYDVNDHKRTVCHEERTVTSLARAVLRVRSAASTPPASGVQNG